MNFIEYLLGHANAMFIIHKFYSYETLSCVIGVVYMEQPLYIVIENFKSNNEDEIKAFIQKTIEQHVRGKLKNN